MSLTSPPLLVEFRTFEGRDRKMRIVYTGAMAYPPQEKSHVRFEGREYEVSAVVWDFDRDCVIVYVKG